MNIRNGNADIDAHTRAFNLKLTTRKHIRTTPTNQSKQISPGNTRTRTQVYQTNPVSGHPKHTHSATGNYSRRQMASVNDVSVFDIRGIKHPGAQHNTPGEFVYVFRVYV